MCRKMTFPRIPNSMNIKVMNTKESNKLLRDESSVPMVTLAIAINNMKYIALMA